MTAHSSGCASTSPSSSGAKRRCANSMRQIDLFRHVLDELPVAAFIKSDDLRIEYVNKAWTSISGISKEEAVGHTDLELFGGDEAEGYTAMRRRGQRHRQGHGDGRAGHPSRRHRQAADDPQEPAGGHRRVGAPGRIEHRHHRREGAREPAQRKPARERGVPQPDRQRAGGDLRQASRPEAVLRQQGLVRSDRPHRRLRGRQDRRRDLRTGRRGLHGRRPRRAARRGARRRSPRPSTAPDGSLRYQIARKSAMAATDGSLYPDRLDDRHHRAQAARAGARAGAAQGGARRPRQVGIPRQYEPRDTHADERRARHGGTAGKVRADAPSRRCSPTSS